MVQCVQAVPVRSLYFSTFNQLIFLETLLRYNISAYNSELE